MPTAYQMIQKADATQLSPTGSQLVVKSLPPFDYSDNIQNSQQLIFYQPNNGKFEQGTTYLIKVNIPQDRNYDLNFGVRLMNLEDTMTGDDLTIKSNFQFIKYISIPRVNNTGVDTNNIWLYHIKNLQGDPETDINVDIFDNMAGQIVVNAAVAVYIEDYTANFNENFINVAYGREQRKNKFFYSHDPNVSDSLIDVIWLYNNEGELIKENGVPKDYFNIIEKNNIILSQNFDSGGAINKNPLSRYFIITPEETCNVIYLYLKPIPEDVDIQWIIEENGTKYTMFGRHIDLTPITNPADPTGPKISPVQGYCWELENILETLQLHDVKNIGVWGRPEQIMAINGQEIRIGPSGYFELKDLPSAFEFEKLCIANTEEGDKYTVDIQYEVTV